MRLNNETAFANALLPTLISSAAYLIVPYPRPIVIFVQYIPAVVAKTLLPYVLSRSTRWRRYGPLVLALCWCIATFIIDVSPPNVPSWIRVSGVVLASFASATGEVFWLGQLSLDGKAGLAGWVVGDGLGGCVCAMVPYLVTMLMGRPLRDGLACAWYLAPLVLASQYIILPQSPKDIAQPSSNGKASARFDVESSGKPFDSTTSATGRGVRSIRLQTLLRPFIAPLFMAFAAQSFAVPGISRATAIQPRFETYGRFLAAYSGIFHLGSLTARSAIFLGRPALKRHAMVVLTIALGFLSATVLLPAATMPILCFPAVWFLGGAVGALYVRVYDSAAEVQTHQSVEDREFKLQIIGVGQSLGLAVGGWAGAVIEASLCGPSSTGGERWCSTTR